MIGRKEKPVQPISSGLNVIGEGTSIEGDLSSNGDLRIDGVVHGNVTTENKCVLGVSGTITGDIYAKSCDIGGKVIGNIKVTGLLLLKNSGKVNGDINTSKMVVESGGEFNGSCVMGSSVTMSSSIPADEAKEASA